MNKQSTAGSKVVFYNPKRAERRSCGSCSACCGAATLKARGAKEFDQVCPSRRVGKKNCCTVYSTRPEDCQMYSCFWLNGFLQTSERPDKLGVILDTCEPSLYTVQHAAGLKHPPILAREAWPGAFNKKEFRRLRDMIASQYVIILVYPKSSGKSSSVYGPDDVRDKVVEAIRGLGSS